MGRIRSANNRHRRAVMRQVEREVYNRHMDRQVTAAIRASKTGFPILIHGRPGAGLAERVVRAATARGLLLVDNPPPTPLFNITEAFSDEPERVEARRKALEMLLDRSEKMDKPRALPQAG